MVGIEYTSTRRIAPLNAAGMFACIAQLGLPPGPSNASKSDS
jgi:hypothetical protein